VGVFFFSSWFFRTLVVFCSFFLKGPLIFFIRMGRLVGLWFPGPKKTMPRAPGPTLGSWFFFQHNPLCLGSVVICYRVSPFFLGAPNWGGAGFFGWAPPCLLFRGFNRGSDCPLGSQPTTRGFFWSCNGVLPSLVVKNNCLFGPLGPPFSWARTAVCEPSKGLPLLGFFIFSSRCWLFDWVTSPPPTLKEKHFGVVQGGLECGTYLTQTFLSWAHFLGA